MALSHTKVTTFQLWGAFLMTCGEFGTATWYVFHEGHYFALFLAFTYAMRETAGGKHYHEIVVHGFNRLRGKAPTRATQDKLDDDWEGA